MKKGILLFVCIVMLLPILLHGEVKQVKVWGKIVGLAGREVVLLDSDYKTEIVRVKGNKDRFELTAKVEVGDARPYFLYLPSLGGLEFSQKVPVIQFFIDTENIQIEAKIKDGNLQREWIKGSPAMLEYLAFVEENPYRKALNEAINVYNIAFHEYNDVNQTDENFRILKQASRRMDSLSVKQSEAFLAMIPENRDSKMLAVIVGNHYGGASVDVLEKLISQFGAGVQESYPILKMKKRIAQVKASAVGSMAPEFELKDLEGNLVKLSSFRGKYVLIDFWASWCGPCRKEIPNIKQVYNSFADKGLVVIGVSVDQNDQEWRQAVKEEQVQYLQLSDIEGITWKLYNFNGIPFITLISPEGVIQNSQIRSALEGYCAVMLAQECRTVHARETLQGMEALLAQQKELIGSIENIPGFVSLDVQFHTAIVQYSGNEELECIFHNHLHYIQRMARRSLAEPGRMAETVKEHQDICDVIRFGDVAHVYTVTIRHMQNSQRMYLEEHASQIHLSLRSNAAGCGP